MISEQSIREIVHTEIQKATDELADATCDVLKSLFEPLFARVSEMEKSLGLLLDGQSWHERLIASQADKNETEPWRESLNDDSAINWDCE